MSTFKRRVEDVHTWPADEEARDVLRDYLNNLSTTPDGATLPAIAGDLYDFSRSDLSGLYFDAAFFFNTNFTRARLKGCSLRKANLNGADLSGADLSDADLYKAEARECLGENAAFQNAYMLGVDLGHAELPGADLRGAILNSGFLIGTNLSGADLRGAHLLHTSFGFESDPTLLPGARLFGAHFDNRTDGWVTGPVDVGEETPLLMEGQELAAWFRGHGAGDVHCTAGGRP